MELPLLIILFIAHAQYILLFLAVLIVSIIILVSRSSKKQKTTTTEEQESVTDPEQDSEPEPAHHAVKKQPNPDLGLNILLYVGALLIVAGVGSFTFLAPPSSLHLVLIYALLAGFYYAGLALRSRATLVPASNAFIGTALALVPLSGFALYGFANLDPKLAWLFSSLLGILIYFHAVTVMRSKVIAYLVIAYLASAACSFTSLFNLPFVCYYIAVASLSFLLAVLTSFISLPALREISDAVSDAGKYLSLIALFCAWSYFETSFVWLYVLLHLTVVVQMLLLCFRLKSYPWELAFRFSFQAFLLIFAAALSDFSVLICVSVIMFTSLLHALFALYSISYRTLPEQTQISKSPASNTSTLLSYELPTLITNLALIPVAPLTLMLEEKPLIFFWTLLIALVLVAILALIAKRLLRNESWLFGVLPVLLFAPYLLLSQILHLSNLVLLIVYLAELASATVFFTLTFPRFARLSPPLKSKTSSAEDSSIERPATPIVAFLPELSIILLALAVYVVLAATPELNFTGDLSLALGLWLGSFALAPYAYKKHQDNLTESIIYASVLGLIAFLSATVFVNLSFHSVIYSVTAYIHIIALTFLLTGLWRRESLNQDAPRLKLSIIGLTVVLGCLTLANAESYPFLAFLFLLEEALILIVGVIKRTQWLWPIGAIGVVLSVMYFTRELAWTWLIILGVALLTFGIYKLTTSPSPKPHPSDKQESQSDHQNK